MDKFIAVPMPLPCPIDGGRAELQQFVVEGFDGEDAGHGYRCVCAACGGMGPWGGLPGDVGKVLAVKRWNAKYVEITVERK